jgi:hypothetical protein
VIDEDKIVVTLFSKKQIHTHLSSKMNETPGILRAKLLRKRNPLNDENNGISNPRKKKFLASFRT